MIEELKNDMESVGIKRSQIFTAVAQVEPMRDPSGIDRLRGNASHQAIGVLVSDTVAYFQDKIHSDLSLWANQFECKASFQDLFDRFIGEGYGKAGPVIYELIRKTAKRGSVLDPVYSAKAFRGC